MAGWQTRPAFTAPTSGPIARGRGFSYIRYRPEAPPWGAGEMAPAIVPAAVCNAVYDAIGVRIRSVPFLPQKVREAMAAQRA